MEIDVDSLITFLIMWGIPTFMVIITYFKMDSDDRNSAKKDFRTPHFIFTIGLLVIGYFLASFGNLLSLKVITLLGIILLVIGGIVSTLYKWKTDKVKSLIIPIFIAVAIFFLIK